LGELPISVGIKRILTPNKFTEPGRGDTVNITSRMHKKERNKHIMIK